MGLGNIFSRLTKNFWHKSHDAPELSRKRAPDRPQRRDFTGGLPANSDMLYGLYYGTVPELQFASPMAYTPVKIPAMLAGIPTPKAADEKTQQAVKDVIDYLGEECPLITETSCLIGTAWRWVRYSSRLKRVIWEVIPDDTITDIEIDTDTNEIVSVWTHEQMRYSSGYNQYQYAERKRRIGRDSVEVKWTAQGSSKTLKNLRMRNPFGFIPVPFGHECRETEWRGHSVYGRILRLFKSNHEIQLNRDEILAKFRPKMVQHTGEDESDAWLENNGYADINAVDPFDADFFINAGEQEQTEFLYLPADATRQHTEAIDSSNKLAVIGSGVPEIFWGTLATGNHASTDIQKELGISYVSSLRREETRPYTVLFNQTLTIKGFIDMTRYSEVKTEWDQFEMVSKETQARIFQLYASGIQTLIQCAGFSYDDIKYFTDKFYADMPDRTREEIKEGMAEMLTDHTLHLSGSVYDATDIEQAGEDAGGEPDTSSEDDDDGSDGEPEPDKKDMEAAE